MRRWRPTPADALTLLRLAAVPVLWTLAMVGLPVALGVVLAVAGLTDVLDGPVARRTGQMSRIGGQLDSVADIVLMASIVAWIGLLHPTFFRDNLMALGAWAVIGTASVAATWWRLGRIGNLHLYSAKAAGVVGYVFVVWLFVLGDYSPVFFTVAVGLAIVASTETLLVALTRDRVDDGAGSILIRRR